MAFECARYRTSFVNGLPTVAVKMGGRLEVFTEKQLQNAITKVRKQRRKYKDEAEYRFVLNTYQQALQALHNDTEVERRR